MPNKNAYGRPAIEVEQNLPVQRIGDFEFVEIVVRFCGVIEHTEFTVTLERVRRMAKQYGPLDDPYEVRPYSFDFVNRPASDEKGYWEFQTLLLTRGHSIETGTVGFCVKMVSTSTVLVEGRIAWDSRRPEPIVKIDKGYLEGIRFLPYLRTPEERAALHGRYPVSIEKKSLSPLGSGQEKAETDILTPTLF
jgi:hypothetical protein